MRPLLLVLLAGAGACTAAAQATWREVPAVEARRTGVFEHPDLSESSGVAASRRSPSLLWSLNDSGNPATLFATDTLGHHRGAMTLEGARNEDWEAIAVGPCDASACVYVADTGDNAEVRESVRLYRIPEPVPNREAGARPQTLDLRYPEGPHDVEAMFVDRAGTVHLISKGRRGIVRHWRIEPETWAAGIARPAPADTVPIPVDARSGRLVTDAALAPDGQRVAIRTYREVFFLQLGPDGSLRRGQSGVACALGNLELQGEGVDWLDDERLVLTSEGLLARAGTVSVVRCEEG